MDKTQEKLSTGKKVNSAIDNASSFYQSRALTNRAADLEGLLDSMGQGIQTIQAANEGIEAITSYVDQLKSIANSAFALDTSNAETYENSIKSYQEQYDKILGEIKNLVKDSSYQGVNLLDNGKLTVTFNETRSHNFKIEGDDVIAGMNLGENNGWTTQGKVDVTTVSDQTIGATGSTSTVAKGSKVYTDGAATGTKYYVEDDKGNLFESSAAGVVATPDSATAATGISKSSLSVLTTDGNTGNYAQSIDATLTKLSDAVDYLRSYSTELGNNYTVIETRQDFTESLIDVLETGSDKLVLADMNEESANYLALQTRQ